MIRLIREIRGHNIIIYLRVLFRVEAFFAPGL